MHRLKISPLQRYPTENIWPSTNSISALYSWLRWVCQKRPAKDFFFISYFLLKPNSELFPRHKWDFCLVAFAVANNGGHSGSSWCVHIPVAFLIISLFVFTNTQELDKYFLLWKWIYFFFDKEGPLHFPSFWKGLICRKKKKIIDIPLFSLNCHICNIFSVCSLIHQFT